MNDNEQRDELAQVIAYEADKHHGFADGNLPPAQQDRELATAIIAAGYAKPRTITTVDELHALAQGTAIRDAEGLLLELDSSAANSTLLEWHFGDRPVGVELPATVLYEPEAKATR